MNYGEIICGYSIQIYLQLQILIMASHNLQEWFTVLNYERAKNSTALCIIISTHL